MPLRTSATPLPAPVSAPGGAPIAATPAAPARSTADLPGDEQPAADEERASEPHHARALRWARRFVIRD
jgi:hypothetical protein